MQLQFVECPSPKVKGHGPGGNTLWVGQQDLKQPRDRVEQVVIAHTVSLCYNLNLENTDQSSNIDQMSLVVRKPVFGVSDQVRHKPGCTAIEDGLRLEISDLGRRGIVLSV